MNVVDVERLREIAEVEFADIVAEAVIPEANELRVVVQFQFSLLSSLTPALSF